MLRDICDRSKEYEKGLYIDYCLGKGWKVKELRKNFNKINERLE